MDRILKKFIQAMYMKIIMKINNIRTLNNNKTIVRHGHWMYDNYNVTTNTICLVDEPNLVSFLGWTLPFGS